MGQCYITRRGTKTGVTEQLGIYPVGNDGRPMGNAIVPSNVKTLSNYIFRENKNILSVSLPEDLRDFENYCFQNCTSLQEITIPDKVDTITQYCFDGCISMYKVVLPKGFSVIQLYAFQNCTGLYEIEIDDGVTNLIIDGYAFSGCKNLDNETITKIATKVGGSIYTYAFANLTGITEVTTNYVNNYYFSGCTNLNKVTVLNPLSGGGFGQYIFKDCSKLNTVVLPDNGTSITSNMFNGNTALKNVNIPKSTVTIGSSAFYNTSINNITLPEGLASIGSNAFYQCTKLTSINIPSTCTTIDAYAFEYCSALADVTIAEGASYTLNTYAFAYCSALTDLSVHDIMEHCSNVYPYVFYNCTGLKNVEVSCFWNDMFCGCTNLITAKSTRASKTGDEVFYGCTKLEEVQIADGTTTIGTRIFYGCTALKKVYLPASITTATSSSLTSTSSSYYTFYNCTALEDVQVGEGWSLSLRLNVSNNITHDSMINLFNNLKDLTGDTAQTLTLGADNLAKLTEDEKAVATNKNWTLA